MICSHEYHQQLEMKQNFSTLFFMLHPFVWEPTTAAAVAAIELYVCTHIVIVYSTHVKNTFPLVWTFFPLCVFSRTHIVFSFIAFRSKWFTILQRSVYNIDSKRRRIEVKEMKEKSHRMHAYFKVYKFKSKSSTYAFRLLTFHIMF